MTRRLSRSTHRLPALLPVPVGQSFAHTLLNSAVAQNRLATAYLFTGPMGVGKAMAARWLATQILWSHRRSDATLSPEAFVRQINAGSYPDFVWVEPTYLVNGALKPASQVPIAQSAHLSAQVRMEQAVQLRQQVSESPLGMRWVVVVDGVERLTNEAGNALLKLLEDHLSCTFILVSSHPHQVLPTIRSRCQRVPFLPLSELECDKVAVQQCPGLAKYPMLFTFAAGSPGLAMQAYHWFCELSPELKTEFAQFAPPSPTAGVLLGLKLARLLAGLPGEVQRLLLRYLQFALSLQPPTDWSSRHTMLERIEQSLGLLDHRVQAQSVWELLLCQCAMQNISWSLELPDEEGDNEIDLDGWSEDKRADWSSPAVEAEVEVEESADSSTSTTASIPAERGDEASQLSMF